MYKKWKAGEVEEEHRCVGLIKYHQLPIRRCLQLFVQRISNQAKINLIITIPGGPGDSEVGLRDQARAPHQLPCGVISPPAPTPPSGPSPPRRSCTPSLVHSYHGDPLHHQATEWPLNVNLTPMVHHAYIMLPLCSCNVYIMLT